MSQRSLSCGVYINHVRDLNKVLEEVYEEHYAFACMSLFHPRLKREFISGPAAQRRGPLTRSDLLLPSADWSSLVVAEISSWIDVESANEAARRNSEFAFKQELSLATHLGVPAVLISVNGPECSNIAKLIVNHIQAGFNHTFWIKIPLVAEKDLIEPVVEDEAPPTAISDTWQWWNALRTYCDSHRRITAVLELTTDLPDDDQIERWCGEPIKALFLSTSLFLTNKSGFPVLSKAHQGLIRKFLKLNIQLVITGVCRHPDKGLRSYRQYLDNLYVNRDPTDKISQFACGYEDYLQCPLQPLMDNLESGTYEVFERDPIKYSQYQKAVYQALLDRVPEEEKLTKHQILMVVGAGRGPLVTASINAALQAQRKIHIYAVEKNSNAVITLQNMKADVWGDSVTVVSSDMRVWQAPEKADIIISELLGSFGDNELSPECLDGAMTFLKEGGISIPCDYTSYLAPLSSSKLWNETKNCKETGKIPEAPFETPYVVRFHNVNVLCKPQPLFTFTHPRPDDFDNNRFGKLKFKVSLDALVHGFAGYFYCTLYKDIYISIVPETHSPGMFSWFPIYFPIKIPVFVRSSETLEVHFWRVCSDQKVWYEWGITAPHAQYIQNPKGRSYTIGL